MALLERNHKKLLEKEPSRIFSQKLFYIMTDVDIKKKVRLARIACLIAIGAVLHTVETIIITALPLLPVFMRLGLANIVTLIAIVLFDTKTGITVAGMRSILGSAVKGMLFSFSFVLSFSGAISSALVMGMVYKYLQFGLIGVSIIGAISSNLAQMIIVYLCFERNIWVFNLLPFLLIIALVGGSINGIIVNYLYPYLMKIKEKL
jgi:heptaprenyl diphosphate synthase